MRKQGRFIVIEGTDGSGKGTQAQLLASRLKKEGKKVVMFDFPQYGKPSAYFVEKYLRGEYGTAKDVGAYRGSMFYALDRYDASFEIRRLLAEGKIVISNRYVSANMGHQAGKLSGKKRDEFLAWLLNLEYGLFGIPEPDQILLLYVDPAVAQALVDKKAARSYTQGKKRDIHEADLSHLRQAAAAYKYVAKKYGWQMINCMKGRSILSIEEIHELVYKAIQ